LASIGIAHPGQMGSAIGAALAAAGHEVRWASEGRSVETRGRAERAGLDDAETLAALAESCELLIAVCPPDAALALASSLRRYDGTYLDANAIAPATALEVAATVNAIGASYADGGLIGPPPLAPGTTRLYLSGRRAAQLARLLRTPLLETIAVGGGETAASAIKMAHAGWTKGSAALLLAMRAAARELGVERALIAEWARSQPGVEARAEHAAREGADKAWRWTGEMSEIALALEGAGLPTGFHEAAREVFERIGSSVESDGADVLDRVLETLASKRPVR
jgi:3-hydroxyisobutyrate dehydrogenase-like beta-hydroxyacid dehydrogenase